MRVIRNECVASTMTQSLDESLGDIIRRNMPDLEPFEDIYRTIHQHPELSRQEVETAKYPAKQLTDLGFVVHTKVGGHGVVGTLQNGHGKTVLLRADMDALPLAEKTGLPYASKSRTLDEDGVDCPVMHACGHDMHVAVLMAAASLMCSAKSSWSGTLICLFQPSEESAGGAAAMVADGLYDKVPIPDILLGQHVVRDRAGTVSIRPGAALAGCDSYHVKIFGKGGHGSKPNLAVNPITIGAHIIAKLPGIITTKLAPDDFGVINVGSIHAGTAENIIPDQLEMKLSVRNYDTRIRDLLHDEIAHLISTESDAASAPHPPQITHTSSAPPTVNDPDLVSALTASFESYFHGNAREMARETASEDFADLATPHAVPYAYWTFGSTAAEKWDDAVRRGALDSIPGNHSPYFAPAVEPTLRTGVEAFALAALTFLRP